MEYYASVKGYLKNIGDVADAFIHKDDFREFSDFGIKGFIFSIKNKKGYYQFFATQLLENGLPYSDAQLVVSGHYGPEVYGYLNEFCVWADLEKNVESFRLLKIPVKKRYIKLKL